MEFLTITIIVILVVAALALVAYPLWQQTRPEAFFRVDRAGQTLEEYQARYQAALVAIKDLMFDHEMGKTSPEDYETLLAQAKREAAEIRRQIDRLSQSGEVASVDTALSRQIESLIAQVRQEAAQQNQALLKQVDAEIELLKDVHLDGRGAAYCPNCGAPVNPGDAFCASCGTALRQPNVCPQCGNPTRPDDAFCTHCGTALKSAFSAQRPRNPAA